MQKKMKVVYMQKNRFSVKKKSANFNDLSVSYILVKRKTSSSIVNKIYRIRYYM